MDAGSQKEAFELVLASAIGAVWSAGRSPRTRSERPAMRLPEIDRGDTLRHRALIGMISRVSGMRLPDAARVAFYDQDFAGPALGEWTQRTMRGPSGWSESGRELMAAAVASWNQFLFCVGAHGAISVHGIDRGTVDAVINDHRTAPISPRLAAALTFIEELTRQPETVAPADARAAVAAGVSPADLEDAAAVAALFNIIARYANALDFNPVGGGPRQVRQDAPAARIRLTTRNRGRPPGGQAITGSGDETAGVRDTVSGRPGSCVCTCHSGA